jgi:glycyl-tRNA synthetase beta chain
MVYEFPELQGVMGEDYARKAGEKEEVARAVFEHYQPRFAGETVPSTNAGAIVSIADKIDTITGCFSIGIIPTGSQDPYALRRQAAGIVQILLDRKLSATLSDVFNIALDVHGNLGNMKRSADEIRKELHEFFGLRVKKLLSETLRYDVVDAVLAAGYDDVASVVNRGTALMTAVQTGEVFKATVESFNRVGNLAAKAVHKSVNTGEFTEQGEKTLYEAWYSAYESYSVALQEGDATRALALASSITPAVTAFFDSVMVMAEDDAVRNNRLALLAAIDSELKRFADFSKLVV